MDYKNETYENELEKLVIAFEKYCENFIETNIEIIETETMEEMDSYFQTHIIYDKK